MESLSIALINPLGDFGINQYCWELSEALGLAGATVRFFTSSAETVPRPEHHTCLPVLHQALFRQRAVTPTYAQTNVAPAPLWIQEALETQLAPAQPSTSRSTEGIAQVRSAFRSAFLTCELAMHLRLSGVDVVWTHWPDLESYAPWFGTLCRKFGMRYVHTVHNTLPHEFDDRDLRLCKRIYEGAELLFTHSDFSRRELALHYPQTADRVRISRHGLYNLYPRFPHRRDAVRAQLGLTAGDTAVLFAGGIRPYKNLDSAIEALRLPGCEQLVLVISGKEAGYPDLVQGAPWGERGNWHPTWALCTASGYCPGSCRYRNSPSYSRLPMFTSSRTPAAPGAACFSSA